MSIKALHTVRILQFSSVVCVEQCGIEWKELKRTRTQQRKNQSCSIPCRSSHPRSKPRMTSFLAGMCTSLPPQMCLFNTRKEVKYNRYVSGKKDVRRVRGMGECKKASKPSPPPPPCPHKIWLVCLRKQCRHRKNKRRKDKQASKANKQKGKQMCVQVNRLTNRKRNVVVTSS